MISKYVHIVFYLIFFTTWSEAQEIQVLSTLDRDSMKIGEQAIVSISAKVPDRIQVGFPTVTDTLTKDIEVLETSPIDSSKKDGTTTYSQDITITVFEAGTYSIPPFGFIYRNDTLNTEPQFISIQTVAIDTSQAFKDIKPVKTVPAPPASLAWLWWLLGILLIAVIGFVLFRKLNKTTTKPKVEIKPVIPAHITALEALSNLEKKQLWQSGHYKDYHSGLTDVMRKYLSDRYNIDAVESTTDQILSLLNKSSLVAQSDLEKVTQIMHLSDLVKFAKNVPVGTENELSLQNAKDFISNTKLI